MNFIDSGVTFKDILNAGLVTGGPKIAKGKYKKDANNNITGNMPVVNAIDIDWNKAEVPGLNDPITSTGQLLALIGQLKQALGSGSSGGDSSSNGILDRLTALESAVQALEQGGQVPDNLLETINQLSNQITLTNTEVGTLRTTVNTLNSSIPNNLNNRLSQAENKITTLESYHTGQTAAATKADITSLRNALNELEALVNSGDNYRHEILSKEQYDSLTTYSANTIYFVTGEPDYIIINNGGGGDEPGGDSVLTTNLMINGQKFTTNGTIRLSPSSTPYQISGILYGQLEIDTTIYDSNDMKNYGNTELVFNGVTIISENECAVLYKTPEEDKGYQGLVINVARNTKNIIICNKQQEKADDQPGAIYSMHDLIIKGPGYLAVRNLGGHAIRGAETNICGPHIYCECIHDGIHGKNITVHCGTIYINQANDGIGTSTNGRIKLFEGSYYGYNIQDKMFDSKQPGLYYKNIKKFGNITMSGMSELNANVFKSITGANTSFIYEFPNESTAKNAEFSAGTLLEDSGDRYVTDANYLYISGVIDKPIELLTPVKQDCTIYLYNAYLTTGLNVPNIYFNPVTFTDGKAYGKVKIIVIKETFSVIENTNDTVDFISPTTYLGDGIKSENNIDIEIKSEANLFITSHLGDGIDGGSVKINDTKGGLVVTNCGQRGIKGNVVAIGYDCEINSSSISYWIDYDFINSAANTQNYTIDNVKPFEGFCTVINNCKYVTVGVASGSSDNERKNTGFADIYGRNGKATKGVIATTHNGCKGIVITQNIAAVVNINLENAQNYNFNNNLSASITTAAPDAAIETYIACDTNRTDISR